MSISTPYVLIASMDVTPEAEALFNEIYDTGAPGFVASPNARTLRSALFNDLSHIG